MARIVNAALRKLPEKSSQMSDLSVLSILSDLSLRSVPCVLVVLSVLMTMMTMNTIMKMMTMTGCTQNPISTLSHIWVFVRLYGIVFVIIVISHRDCESKIL